MTPFPATVTIYGQWEISLPSSYLLTFPIQSDQNYVVTSSGTFFLITSRLRSLNCVFCLNVVWPTPSPSPLHFLWFWTNDWCIRHALVEIFTQHMWLAGGLEFDGMQYGVVVVWIKFELCRRHQLWTGHGDIFAISVFAIFQEFSRSCCGVVAPKNLRYTMKDGAVCGNGGDPASQPSSSLPLLRRTTTILFTCDEYISEHDAVPVLYHQSENCDFTFHWISRAACPVPANR